MTALAFFVSSVWLCLALLLIVFYLLHAYYWYHYTVPFLPTRRAIVADMLERAGAAEGVRVLDLGAGAGDIVLEAARRGCVVTGIECNPLLVMVARFRIWHAGLGHLARIQTGDFFANPLSPADIVTVYLLPEILVQLRKPFLRDLPPHATIVSHQFAIKDWKPVYDSSKIKVYRLPGHPPLTPTLSP